MTTATTSRELELQRRLSGLKFSQLARESGIDYHRLWRFFNSGSPLSSDEEARVKLVLQSQADDFGGVAGEQNVTPASPNAQAEASDD